MKQSSLLVDSGATFSECRRYRYTLWRRWADGPPLVAICLNPSTADESANDATVERMVRRSQTWGFPAFVMLNLFAWRSTDPKGLLTVADPVGPENDAAIVEQCWSAATVICAWGSASPLVAKRSKAVLALLEGVPLHYLFMGAEQPSHPLYLAYNLTPQKWGRV